MFSEHATNYVVMMLVVTTTGLCGASGSKTGELWRLGEHDGLWREFRSYYAWEYGREPWVAASPDMDFATHTWTYRVPGPGLLIRRGQDPAGTAPAHDISSFWRSLSAGRGVLPT